MGVIRTRHPRLVRHRAKRLRLDPTRAERELWDCLRDRRLDRWKWRRQVVVGPFIVDFLFRDARLIVEIDGFQHAESLSDQRRTEWLNANGYSVLRFWNQEIVRERRSVLETILAALEGRLQLSSELPSFYSPAKFTDTNGERS